MIGIGIAMTEGQDIETIEIAIETEIVDPEETGTISMTTGEIEETNKEAGLAKTNIAKTKKTPNKPPTKPQPKSPCPLKYPCPPSPAKEVNVEDNVPVPPSATTEETKTITKANSGTPSHGSPELITHPTYPLLPSSIPKRWEDSWSPTYPTKWVSKNKI